MKKHMCGVCSICAIVLAISGLHFLLMGIAGYDLLGMLSGGSDSVMRVYYILIAIATIGMIGGATGKCKMCKHE